MIADKVYAVAERYKSSQSRCHAYDEFSTLPSCSKLRFFRSWQTQQSPLVHCGRSWTRVSVMRNDSPTLNFEAFRFIAIYSTSFASRCFKSLFEILLLLHAGHRSSCGMTCCSRWYRSISSALPVMLFSQGKLWQKLPDVLPSLMKSCNDNGKGRMPTVCGFKIGNALPGESHPCYSCYCVAWLVSPCQARKTKEGTTGPVNQQPRVPSYAPMTLMHGLQVPENASNRMLALGDAVELQASGSSQRQLPCEKC